MEIHTYWHKQTIDTPLYPDILWNKPEQRSQAGKLGIVGGNTLGFSGVAEAYRQALEAGVGDVRVLLPDTLRKTILPSITEAVFGHTTPSGGLGKEALAEIEALGNWANGILLVGDAGRNSETAILYETFLQEYTGQLTLTRDAVDLIKNSSQNLIERPNTPLVVSVAQLQKIFQQTYYPRILTFSMQLSSLVETVHKFTITYPVCIMVLHKDYLVIAHRGEVTTTAWDHPMAIWRGGVATRAACYWLWNPGKVLEATTTSLCSTVD